MSRSRPPPLDRSSRRRGHSRRREDRRRRRRGGARPRRAPGSRQDVNARTRSMGVALTSCTVPAAGSPLSRSARTRWRWASASTASRAPARCARRGGRDRGGARDSDLQGPRAEARPPVLLFVNGFGGTPAMELYLMLNAARGSSRRRADGRAGAHRQLRDLARHGRLLDDRPADEDSCALLDAPVHTAALRWAMRAAAVAEADQDKTVYAFQPELAGTGAGSFGLGRMRNACDTFAVYGLARHSHSKRR